MQNEEPRNDLERFEEAVAGADEERYLLRLYVAGTTPSSMRAIANLKKVCEEELKGRYDLEVVDIYQQPEVAEREQLIAVPVLIKKLPAPLRRVIGDLSDREKVLVGLNLKPKAS